MELLDRYLKAVGKYLPESQKEDILQELSEDIRSALQDREEQLGRRLTPAEQESFLKARGNPFHIASKFRENQGSLAFGPQLIGPVLFPFYLKVLRFNLGLTFFILVAIYIALFAGGENVGFSGIFSNFLLQLFLQLGAVTLIFVLVEKRLGKAPEPWNLGEVKFDSRKESPCGNSQRVSRFESFSLIVGSLVFLAWLKAIDGHPFLLFGPAASYLKLAPIWHQIYLPSLLVMLAVMLRAAINLFRPEWKRLRDVTRIVADGAALVILAFLVSAREWVIAADPQAGRTVPSGAGVAILNRYIFYSLLCAGAVFVFQVAVNVLRLLRGGKKHDSLL